jgi:outer membrane protein assembly factor BamB
MLIRGPLSRGEKAKVSVESDVSRRLVNYPVGVVAMGCSPWSYSYAMSTNREIVALFLPGSASASEWPVYRGDEGQDRLSAFYPGLEFGQLWMGPSASSSGRCVVASQGRLFAVIPSSVGFGEASLYAFEASNGHALWHTAEFELPEGTSCPATDGSHVYAIEGVLGESSLHAYNVAAGSSAWTRSLSGDASSPPTVSEGAVYVTVAFGACGDEACNDAVNAADGSILWSVRHPSQAQSPPVVIGKALLQTERSEEGMTAYGTSSGTELWSDPNSDGLPVGYQMSTTPTKRAVKNLPL